MTYSKYQRNTTSSHKKNNVQTIEEHTAGNNQSYEYNSQLLLIATVNTL